MKFASRVQVAFMGLTVLAALGTVSAPAATTRDDQADSDYVALGALADFAPVGLLNAGAYTGCGILIAPDWVLTAAHLLVAASSGTFTIGGASYGSSEIYRNPGWTGDVLKGNDYGLVHLSSPVSALSPALFFTGSSETGHVATFVGFGFKGTGLTGWKTLDGQKRAFQNMIDGEFGNPYLLLGTDFDNPNSAGDNWFGSALPQSLEGCVAPGDSGGGVFIQQGGQYYLGGVISGVLATDGSANSDYGDITAYGRIAAAMPWINQTMGVPEPSGTALLLTSAGAALVF